MRSAARFPFAGMIQIRFKGLSVMDGLSARFGLPQRDRGELYGRRLDEVNGDWHGMAEVLAVSPNPSCDIANRFQLVYSIFVSPPP